MVRVLIVKSFQISDSNKFDISTIEITLPALRWICGTKLKSF